MFIENLEKVLREKGISMNKLAEMLDISQAGVSRWKHGAVPGIDKLIKICEILEVSADELLDLKLPNKEAPPNMINQFSKTELELINEFRELNIEQQRMIMLSIKAMTTDNQIEEKSLNSAG